MKLILCRLHFFVGLLSLLFGLVACESATQVGVEVRPDQDVMAVKTCSFPVETSLVVVDSIYGRSQQLLLGRYTDPLFGTLQADFMVELRYLADTFPANTVGDSLVFVIFYRDYFGDSLSVQEMSAYKLNVPLNFSTDYYSNTQPFEFTDCSELFARTAYVPYNLTVSDSERASGYVNQLRVRMPDAMMQTLITDHSLTTSQNAFCNFLNGLYVTNTYGEGCVLITDSVNLELSFHVKRATDTDSVTYRAKRIYAANLESTEVLHIAYPNNDRPTREMLSSQYGDSVTLVSSPAGLYTKVRIPFDSIYRKVYLDEASEDPSYSLQINHAAMVVEIADIGYDGSLTPPEALMLIREEDMTAFFTQSLYPAPGIPTILGMYDEQEKGYLFGNMGAYVQSVLKSGGAALETASEFVLVPVSGATDVYSLGNTIRPLLKPSGGILRSGSNASPMRISVTYTHL